MTYEDFYEVAKRMAPIVVVAALSYIAGMAITVIQMKKLWMKRVAEAGNCPRCVQYHGIAKYARKLIGVRLRSVNLAGQNSEVIRNAVNGIAREAEYLPPPMQEPIVLRQVVPPRDGAPRA